MRKFLALALASTFLTVAPVDVSVVEAASFFDKMFPRAAERRRKRQLKRQRELRRLEMIRRGGAGVKKKVAGPKFKNYTARKMSSVPLSKLSVAFAAYDKRILAKEAEKKSKEATASEVGATVTNTISENETTDNNQTVTEVVAATEKTETATPSLAPIRLAAGAEYLKGIKLKTRPGLSKALITRYKSNPRFLWVDGEGKPNERAIAVQKILAQAALEGLGTEDYPVPVLEAKPSEEAKVEVEIKVETAGGTSIDERSNVYVAQNTIINDTAVVTDSDITITGTTSVSDKEQNSATDGLSTQEEPFQEIPAEENPVQDTVTEDDTLRAAMQFEFAMTVAVLRYMADAKNGVVDPNRISGYHDFKGLGVNYGRLMKALAKSETPDELMLSQHPRDNAYKALKTELAELRSKVAEYDAIIIKAGTLIKPDQSNDQLANVVESIRRNVSKDFINNHFDVFMVDHSEGDYSGDVVEMVRDFQSSVNLKPDGIVGRNTIARMGSSDPHVQINKVLYAMERLRWQPDSLGNTHVFINQPAYRATYVRNGVPKLSMRAVVGKPGNQTYFFHDKIEYVEFNPYWGIPKSILVNEMLPKLRQNPSHFDNLGYEVTNVRGKQIYSSEVDWWSVGADFPYDVRQPPGAKNALGELKIMFPNSHSIYMHDTPAKSLFKRSTRAFSHGCVRLAEPRRMAAAVLRSSVGHVAAQLADGQNKQQRLKSSIPVYVSYFTAWPNSSGDVKFYADVYGRDKALSKAFAKEEASRAKARGA